MRAAVFGTVTLLICVFGGDALDLLRATTTSGIPPSTPSVHCRCAAYPNVTLCAWPQPSQSAPTHYIASYSERYREGNTTECHPIPPGALSPSSEQLWYCQLADLKLLTDYIINITAVHPAGSSSHLESFMLEDIVKPDPPVNVTVSPHNVRNVLVEWAPPSTWTNLDIFPLKYHIQYKWQHMGASKSVNLGPFENTSLELKGLTPGRPYLFQVCAKELLGLGECSDWSLPVNVTIPRAKP